MKLPPRALINRVAIFGIGGVVCVGAGWMAYQRFYASPMRDAQERLTRFQNASRAYDAELDSSSSIRARVREIASTTLGTREEEVAHRFRTLMHEIGVQSGLSGIVVSEGRTAAVVSPAQRARLIEFRGRRDELLAPDFAVMQGEVRGVGTLDAVARVLALASKQSWIHRVTQFSITPTGDDRSRFEVRVSAATLILPDIDVPNRPEATVVPLTRDDELAWAPVAARNVFRMPDPPVVVQAVAPPPPPPPPPAQAQEAPPPAYHLWRLTGVMQGSRGVTVVMLDQSTGRSRTLEVGEAVLDATLVSAGGESAQFRLGGSQWTLNLGQSLADRRPVPQNAEQVGNLEPSSLP